MLHSSPVGLVLYLILTVFFYVLIVRFVMEWILVLARSFRPSGGVAVLFEAIYTVTDPPLKLIRRFVPPLAIGGFRLDLAFLLLLIVVQILRLQVRAL